MGLELPRFEMCMKQLIFGMLFALMLLFASFPLASGAAGGQCPTPNDVCACDPNCQGGYEIGAGFNTLDSCEDGVDQSTFEWVEKMIITDQNGTNFKGGDTVEVFGQFYCYVGDPIGVAYTNFTNGDSTIWTSIYSTTCPGYNFQDVTFDYELDNAVGTHAFRFIIAYPGATGMTCGQTYSSSDTDDVQFLVEPRPDTDPPYVTIVTPTAGQNIEYTTGLEVPIRVSASDETGISFITANISWEGGNVNVPLYFDSLDYYNNTLLGLTNITRYNVTYFAGDTLGNNQTYTSHFFISNNANINISSPEFGREYNTSQIPLDIRIHDNNTPYLQVYYELNDGPPVNLTSFSAVNNNASESTERLVTNALGNLSQSFTLPTNTSVNDVVLRLRVSGSGFTNQIQIRNDDAGSPGNVVYFNETVDAADIDNKDFLWYTFSSTNTSHLESNVTYWLLLTGATPSDYLEWEVNDDRYENGSLLSNVSQDVLFMIKDEQRYTTMLNATEGSNSLEVIEFNKVAQEERSISNFVVDTIAPTYQTPVELSDPFEFGPTYQIITVAATDATTGIDTVRFEANFTNQSTDFLGGGAYQYRWPITSLGTYFYRLYLNDSVNNRNETPLYNFTVVDTEGPISYDLMYTPNETATLDPNVPLFVNATLFDYSGVGQVILQYQIQNASTWQNATMYNTSTRFMGNFTPDSENNWTFRILSYDIYNNTRTNLTTNVSVFLDRTWHINDSTIEEKFTTQGSTVTIGNVTINNTGDYSLDFTLEKLSGIPPMYFNTTAITVAANERADINVTVVAPEQSPTPYPYTIRVNCISSGCAEPNATISDQVAVGEGGSYLTASDVVYDPSVIQGQRGITLNATLKNIGNETAFNITAEWILPDSWTTGNAVNFSYSNLTEYRTTFATYSPGIVASVGLDATPGTVNLSLRLTYNTSYGQTRQNIITKVVTVSVNELIEGAGGGGSGGGTGGGAGGGGSGGGAGGGGAVLTIPDYNLTITGPSIIEILRGENKTISFNVTNQNGVDVNNISLVVNGFPSSRHVVTPSMLSVLPAQSSARFEVYFSVPLYMGYSTTDLELVFTGVATTYGRKSDIRQVETLTLIVSEINQNESLQYLAQAQTLLQEIEASGLNSDRFRSLLDDAQESFLGLDYTRVGEIVQEMVALQATALAVQERFDDLHVRVDDAATNGYDVESVSRLIAIAEELFNQGAFEDADEALARAEEAFALQIQLEDAQLGKRLVKLWTAYWWLFISSLIVAVVAVGFGYMKAAKQRVKDKLAALDTEETAIKVNMKELQHRFFVDKTVSSRSYANRIESNKKRLAELEQERIDLRNIEIKFFKTGDSIESLRRQQQEMTDLVTHLQEQYFIEKTLNKDTYQKSWHVYRKRLAEIKKRLEVLETAQTEAAGKKSFGKKIIEVLTPRPPSQR